MSEGVCSGFRIGNDGRIIDDVLYQLCFLVKLLHRKWMGE